MRRLLHRVSCLSLLAAVLVSCNSPFTPKPKGYFHIALPAREYRVFDRPGFPYTFEYPAYASIEPDSSFFGEKPENPWWINVSFPRLGGKIYLSYKQVEKYRLDKLITDAFNMTGKHSVRANSIDDSLLATPNGVHGIFFRVGGDVATSNQFFLTDSTHHFLRGALYFDATPNADSLQPVNRFLVGDMLHMIQTLKWRPAGK